MSYNNNNEVNSNEHDNNNTIFSEIELNDNNDNATTFKDPPRKLSKSTEYVMYLYSIAFLSNCFNGIINEYINTYSSLLQSKFQWTSLQVLILVIIYHLSSAMGAFFTVFTSTKSNRKGVYYSSMLMIFTFIVILPFAFTSSHIVYYIIFYVICFTNGHIWKNNANLIVEKSLYFDRGFFFFISFIGFILGQVFIIIAIIFSQDYHILISKIIISLIICIQFVFVTLLIREMFYYMKAKVEYKQRNQMSIEKKTHEKKSIFNEDEMSIISLKNSLQTSFNRDMKEMFIYPMKQLMKNSLKYNTLSIWVIEILIGFLSFTIWSIYYKSSGFIFKDYSQIQYSLIFKFIQIIFLLVFSWSLLKKKLSPYQMLIHLSIYIISTIMIVLTITKIRNNPFTIDWYNICFHLYNGYSFITYILIQLYIEEATKKNLMNLQTAIGYLLFKLSSLVQVFLYNYFSEHSRIFSIINLLVITIIIVVVIKNKSYEIFFKRKEDIDKEINDRMTSHRYDIISTEIEMNKQSKT